MCRGESKELEWVDPSVSPEKKPMEDVGRKGLNTTQEDGNESLDSLLFILLCSGKQNLSLILPFRIPIPPLLVILGVLCDHVFWGGIEDFEVGSSHFEPVPTLQPRAPGALGALQLDPPCSNKGLRNPSKIPQNP